MNPAFKSMSDLVADSEDLLARIGRSEIPQVRALSDDLRVAVDRMSEQLRTRAKKLRAGLDVPRSENITHKRAEIRWLYVTVAASLAVGVLAWLRIMRHARDAEDQPC